MECGRGAGGGGRVVFVGGGAGDPAEQHPYQALHSGGAAVQSRQDRQERTTPTATAACGNTTTSRTRLSMTTKHASQFWSERKERNEKDQLDGTHSKQGILAEPDPGGAAADSGGGGGVRLPAGFG